LWYSDIAEFFVLECVEVCFCLQKSHNSTFCDEKTALEENMAQLATISARIDKDDKIRFDEFCNAVGLNASIAINLFVKTVLRRREIPFSIESDEKTFRSESDMAELKRRVQDLRANRNSAEHDIVEVD